LLCRSSGVALIEKSYKLIRAGGFNANDGGERSEEALQALAGLKDLLLCGWRDGVKDAA
jgi:hypothetical protein